MENEAHTKLHKGGREVGAVDHKIRLAGVLLATPVSTGEATDPPPTSPGRARASQAGRQQQPGVQDRPQGDPEWAKTVVGYLRPTRTTREGLQESRAVPTREEHRPHPALRDELLEHEKTWQPYAVPGASD